MTTTTTTNIETLHELARTAIAALRETPADKQPKSNGLKIQRIDYSARGFFEVTNTAGAVELWKADRVAAIAAPMLNKRFDWLCTYNSFHTGSRITHTLRGTRQQIKECVAVWQHAEHRRIRVKRYALRTLPGGAVEI